MAQSFQDLIKELDETILSIKKINDSLRKDIAEIEERLVIRKASDIVNETFSQHD